MIAAVLEVDEAIRTVVATLELKLEEEQCVDLLIKGKDVVALLPTGKSLLYHLALLVVK